jgi:8-oxo-dGTP pyrophosphatase MutT (NUDIX family)
MQRGAVNLRPGWGIRLESAKALLEQHEPVASVERDWPAGRIRLSAYLGACQLPSEIPGRVRCLVTDGEVVLLTRDQHGYPDCFPGGGADDGETIAETARREVWEETGWHIDVDTIAVIGWIHLESLSEPSPDRPFPSPDVFMTVLQVEPSHAEAGHETWIDTEGFILESRFIAVEDLPVEIWADPISASFLGHTFGVGTRVP